MYQTSGTIKLIDDVQTFASGFTKREFVITTSEDRYPQHIKFELVKDKTSLLDQFSIGQEVTVSFDIRGNEYNGRYFVNLHCWKIEAGVTEAQNQSQPAKKAASSRPSAAKTASPNTQSEPDWDDMRHGDDNGDDDIPF